MPRRRRAPLPRGAFTVDRMGNYHDGRTGEFTMKGPTKKVYARFKHPRRRKQYSFAMILNPAARKKWTPNVSIKTVRRRRAG